MNRFFRDLRALILSEAGLWKYPMMWVSAAAVLFVPVLYAVIYLSSAWDPYNNLNRLPVAFVNLDAGTTYRGKTYNLGRELVETVRVDQPVKFVAYDTEDKARAAVRHGDAYFALTIPVDFSQKAIAGNSGQYGMLKLYSSEGSNYFASRVGTSFADKLATSLNKKLSETRWESVKKAFTDVQKGFSDVKTATGKLRGGADQLQTGLEKVTVGSKNLAGGLKQAKVGSDQLAQGASGVSSGVVRLTQGAGALEQGLRKMDQAMPKESDLLALTKGAQQLGVGLTGLSDGLKEINGGAIQLSKGSNSAAKGFVQTQQGLQRLAKQLPQISSGLGQFKPAIEQAATSVHGFGDSISKLQVPANQIYTQVSSGPSDLQDKAKALVVGISRVKSGVNKLEGGIRQLLDGNQATVLALQKASGAAQQLSIGFDVLGVGLKTLGNSVQTLSLAIQKAYRGAEALQIGALAVGGGVQSLVEGNLKIKSGVRTMVSQLPASADLKALATGSQRLAEKTQSLSQGLGTLQKGASDVAVGSDRLYGGAQKLKKGLDDLYSAIPETVEQLGGDPQGLATSVKVTEEKTNRVQNNGAAFAPYFMAVSLWVGIVSLTFILPFNLLPESLKGTSKLSRLFVKNGIPTLMCFLQGCFVVWGVGLLGLPIPNLGAVLVVAFVTSLTFLTLITALMLVLANAGRVIALLFLVLQLGASGGSYPVELSPVFFQRLHSILPVTGAIKGFRAALFGSYDGDWLIFVGQMSVIWAVCLAIILLIGRWRLIKDENYKPSLA